jgi:NAD(P)-dependent dehydrogenase (short-subunit alcohol dehydrogenase family)
MTKSWAAEFGPSGVRVNAVSPGPTRTPGVEMMGGALDQLAAQSPAGYVAAPEDIAAVIAFLAGDDARYMQGRWSTCRVRWSTWTAAGPPSRAAARRAGNSWPGRPLGRESGGRATEPRGPHR